MVAVGYEQARGLRKPHQRADDFSATPMTATGPYDTVAVTSEDGRGAEPEGGGGTVVVDSSTLRRLAPADRDPRTAQGQQDSG